jgi:glycosyltransferase involved in cell wall biosynthesis
MKVSVVICTFNRSALLRDSILAVLDQDFPFAQYEVIVVDNNSSDNTKEVVAELARAAPTAIRYVFEARQGLSYARNTGISETRGKIIAFTDDDIDAEKNWLQEIVSAFESPEVDCVGGPIRPVWPGIKPEWITPRWESALSVSEFELARPSGEFKWPHYPWGANIAFRRETFEQFGLFPTNLGRVGKNLLSNEEIALCRRIEKGGRRIKFAPKAVIHHKISPERIRKQWFFHRMYYQGRSNAILDADGPLLGYRRIRNYSREMCDVSATEDDRDFHNKCVERALIGYLYQALSLQEESGSGASFRHLRLLKTTLSAFFNHYHQQALRERQIKDSYSWRITAPLRWLLKIIKGHQAR